MPNKYYELDHLVGKSIKDITFSSDVVRAALLFDGLTLMAIASPSFIDYDNNTYDIVCKRKDQFGKGFYYHHEFFRISIEQSKKLLNNKIIDIRWGYEKICKHDLFVWIDFTLEHETIRISYNNFYQEDELGVEFSTFMKNFIKFEARKTK